MFFLLGCRDDGGRLVRTERLRTKDIAHRARLKNYWQVSIISLNSLIIIQILLKLNTNEFLEETREECAWHLLMRFFAGYTALLKRVSSSDFLFICASLLHIQVMEDQYLYVFYLQTKITHFSSCILS